ncbi:S1C family serine protease [Patulibacter americanus]|uniref:S1C family serine protease n=1 Tax=Patulibacter americanus TaxID=588672 RepID=UPI0003B5D255|nr:trypsin-like peptidase domain-containing protein [Patulibacter americanus]
MPPEHRSLWSDGPSEDDHHGWLEPEPERPAEEPTREHRADETSKGRRTPRDSDAPSAWSRLRRRLVTPLVALCVVALLVSGIAIGMQLVGTRDVERTVVQSSGGAANAAAVKAAYEATHDGVVRVSTNSGNGTGWVYDARGTIVTNNHVVSGGGDSIKVRFGDRGEDVPARLLGTDVSSDLAVLRVDPADVQKLVPLKVADSDSVQTGDPVIAIGYPLGLDQTTTAGIISGVGRQIRAQNSFSIDRVLQTDAPINPGNSGGPLLDMKGRVVGVNSQIATTGGGGGSVGIGFAVPSNTVKSVVPVLERGGTVKHAYLGVQVAELTGTDGAAVAAVTPGGPAARADLRASSNTATLSGRPDGDVIVEMDGERVDRADDVTRIVNSHQPGDKLKLQVERDGDRRTVEVTLGDRPATTGSTSGGSGPGGGITPTPTTPTNPTTPPNPLAPSIP